jgi:YebC/PmpR family DNA-binding regulatory protein
MYRKGAQDAKRAKTFAKIGREIFVAAKLGGNDASSNPRLRAALANARSVNMPNDNINRILKKAMGNEATESYEEVRYEGFGVGGVAVIVEALTDNRNRTASEVRSVFSKFGGNLGDAGSVSFMFDRVGKIYFSKEAVEFDALFEMVAEAGADDVEESEPTGQDGQPDQDEQSAQAALFEVTCKIEAFGQARDILTEKIGEPVKSEITWIPKNTVVCDFDATKTLLKMIDAFEDNDDVQNVYTNFECSDDVKDQIDQEYA